MKRLFLPLAAAFCLTAAPATAQVLSGAVTAVDGDTLDFTGTRVRLAGIDAPERAQTCLKAGAEWTCGEEAAVLLQRLSHDAPVTCMIVPGGAAGGLPFARCSGAVPDLSLSMVGAGLAVALPDDAGAGEVEARARRFALGLWAAEFEQPAAWRLAHPAPKPRSAPAPRIAARQAERVYRNEWGCAIKGNRSYRGPWIYHLPGMKHYEQTRAEEFFCTEAAAQAAGYRRSKDW